MNTNTNKTRALTFTGTNKEFGKYLSLLGDFILANPGMTIGEFADYTNAR